MPKTLTLIVFFAISFVYDSFGQEYSWKIGVSGGPNLRNLHVKNRLLWEHPWINENSDESSLLAWDIGLTLEKTINERWSISWIFRSILTPLFWNRIELAICPYG